MLKKINLYFITYPIRAQLWSIAFIILLQNTMAHCDSGGGEFFFMISRDMPEKAPESFENGAIQYPHPVRTLASVMSSKSLDLSTGTDTETSGWGVATEVSPIMNQIESYIDGIHNEYTEKNKRYNRIELYKIFRKSNISLWIPKTLSEVEHEYSNYQVLMRYLHICHNYSREIGDASTDRFYKDIGVFMINEVECKFYNVNRALDTFMTNAKLSEHYLQKFYNKQFTLA